MSAHRSVVTLASLVLLALVGLAAQSASGWRGGPQSCSTFMLAAEGTLLVGHNLDEGFEVPGQITVNPRGLAKQNVSWEDLKIGGKGSIPRLRWVSKYGSITYNTVGREFIDGGMNEVGLYVGEMTLLGSVYPSDPKLPAFYHHQWMQYLLDSFATVPEVLDSLAGARPDGHCQWHFLVADRAGRAAVIEFLDGRAVVHTGAHLPITVLGNLAYDDEMKALTEFEGFGGAKKVDFADRENGRRFVWGAKMLRDFGARAPAEAVPYAFSILAQLDKGATKWSLVFDIPGGRVSWRTNKARDIRFADLASFDLSCGTPALVLDIHGDASGDVANRFTPYNDTENAAAVKAALKPWPMGAMGNTFLKPRMVERMSKVPATFACMP
jgi:choloylglycine hydrolase